MKDKYFYLPTIPCLTALVYMAMLGLGCKPKPAPVVQQDKPPVIKKISFKEIEGIPYTEVKRVYDNGLSFGSEGYQLIPDWQITFLPKDSMRIYSPKLKRFVITPAMVDHGNVVNLAWSWLRVMKMSKDSLVFKVLHVTRIIEDGKPPIFLTLYSNDYIKNVLHKTPAEMIRPSRRDTLFIQEKVKQSKADYSKAFAATTPVTLTSINTKAAVKRQPVNVDPLNNIYPQDAYLSPTFEVTIRKSYSNFDHFMLVVVDENGKLHFIKSLDYMMDDGEQESHLKAMKGIVDGYLSYYFKATPGKTLGITHASAIMIKAIGIAD
ncbi:hypothetical protein KHS38_03785 [Mucilaginibacter sp. Bleaf8]|uniref:hypothetical protein n=1 Tax=Mucilaginibacter sp. Bleaf8 TaxID=2834430 RepID=UPI001BD155B5|nr:hypothetical protein [Mucilaginibacter sp. Bleaf8]MBS7563517.1 hypothetical protein [Mucilaginibacter sp. Bleaf8]